MLRRTWFWRVSAATSAVKALRGLSHDPSLVNLPGGVGNCHVYRNVISDYDEELIAEELSRILPKEGQSYYADPTRLDKKVVRNVYLELYGYRDFTEAKSWKRSDTKRIPGFAWSPTALKFAETFGVEAVGEVPDAARVVEHHLPGYEMHTEHPTVGRAYMYLNLLSDTVLAFDDEATQRSGMVYLPQRSLMVLSGEVRWGWRFGEQPSQVKTYVGPTGLRKTVRPDLRLSIQMWKFDTKLVDRRQLQDDLEAAVKEATEKAAEAQKMQAIRDAAPKSDEPAEEPLRFTLPPQIKEKIMGSGSSTKKKVPGPQPSAGALGGDMVRTPEQTSLPKKSLEELERDMKLYKSTFNNVQGVMKEMKAMQDANMPITDEWILEKTEKTKSRAFELDADYNFDPSNPEAAWDDAVLRAKTYKQRLKDMSYDESVKKGEAMDLGFDPDDSGPLDVKETLRKLAPHIKDGEKILSEFPAPSGGR